MTGFKAPRYLRTVVYVVICLGVCGASISTTSVSTTIREYLLRPSSLTLCNVSVLLLCFPLFSLPCFNQPKGLVTMLGNRLIITNSVRKNVVVCVGGGVKGNDP